MIIGISGFIGSGKDTAANYLVGWHGFRRDSFAGALKDAVATVFGWDRELLEGLTPESRQWRDQVDTWWAKRLNMPNLTPRWILQYWGTEVCRGGFHDDIWIAALENRLRSRSGDTVITDVRFPNEIKTIRNAGGIVIWIKRGELPEWYSDALRENTTPEDQQWLLEDAHQLMPQKYPNVHASEYSWVGTMFNAEIDNNGTVDQLHEQLKNLLLSQRVSS
ncbi:hypothetical protein UFOVP257_30 [uncultured Caudovirales phage]|uniref:Deoxynucleoside monophosphate kinase n=1 Tax=uncultured Caudovirales phage TaxID=2100421 RepID=A0A6J5LIT6_9CAUD|nr:hypothetical protein UFOVP257_30 [uncultured Caudovirales phage]